MHALISVQDIYTVENTTETVYSTIYLQGSRIYILLLKAIPQTGHGPYETFAHTGSVLTYIIIIIIIIM